MGDHSSYSLERQKHSSPWRLTEPKSSPKSAQQHLDFLPIQKWSPNAPKVTLDASLKTMNTPLKSKVNKLLPILLLVYKICT